MCFTIKFPAHQCPGSLNLFLLLLVLLLTRHALFFLCVTKAPPRQCIDLHFEENYSIESSWECKFDNIEVRDGPFGFSPLLGRYCGQHSPPDIRSSGRYLWIKFVTDGELEAVGFSASYNFTAGTPAQPRLPTTTLSLYAARQQGSRA